MKLGKFDFHEMKAYLEKLEKVDAEFEKFCFSFLAEVAGMALRKLIKRTPVGSGDLRRSWSLGALSKVGGVYQVQVVNTREYASYINDGFKSHFVPGYWEGSHFIYDPGCDEGMYVGKPGVVLDGAHMIELTEAELQRTVPKRFETRFWQWARSIGL